MGDLDYEKEYRDWKWDIPEYFNMGYDAVDTHLSDPGMKDIQVFMKENAAPYKYPREIEFVNQLPKTQSGKIKRKQLREQEIEKKRSR